MPRGIVRYQASERLRDRSPFRSGVEMQRKWTYKSMGHKSCIEGSFNSSNPHRKRALSFKLCIYSWVSTKVDWPFLQKVEINEVLIGISSWEMLPFSGNVPEMIALYP